MSNGFRNYFHRTALPGKRDGGDGSCKIRSTGAMDTGFFARGMDPMVALLSHWNLLPNLGMQERCAPGARRTAALRAALHAFGRGQLFGDAAGNRAGQRAA